MTKIKLYRRYLNLILRGKIVKDTDIGQSYTKVSKYYENVFLSAMHRYNDMMLEELLKSTGKRKNPRILDLACGTGYNTKYLIDKYVEPVFSLCDISEGMLKKARESISDKSIVYSQKSMLDYLRKCENGTFDIIICSWAIKYASPRKVIAECNRVLKPEGYLVCIVNTKFTLPQMRKILPKLFESNEYRIKKVMLELPNPISRITFDRWFTRQKFRKIYSQKGQHIFRFRRSKELVKFAISTGALAGYDQMLDLRCKSIISQMIQYIKCYKIHSLTHKFVWGIYRKNMN